MNNRYLDCLVSPQTHMPLKRSCNRLVTEDGNETYEVRKGVPIMLPEGMAALWQRELIEAILWEFPDEIENMNHQLRKQIHAPDIIQRKFIKNLVRDKNGILSALEHYAVSDTTRWICLKREGVTVTARAEEAYDKNTANGVNMVNRARKSLAMEEWAIHMPYYVSEVYRSDPKTVVEHATGAGLGTSAIALLKPKDCLIFTVDIDFYCHGNAAGIAEHLGLRDSLLSVAANFWHMPFADSSTDVVCSHYGLDESREIPQIIAETARVLKSGGSFICTVRKSAFMRQYVLLEPFGFTQEETVRILDKCRLYSDINNLIDCCKQNDLFFKKRKSSGSVKTTRQLLQLSKKSRLCSTRAYNRLK